jgi:hypothetical protein
MRLQRNWQLFIDTFSIARRPLQLAYPTLLEFVFFLSYFFFFWFIFAPLLYNALGALLTIAQQIREGSLDVSLQTAFDYALYDVLKIVALFVLCIYVLWSFFGTILWKWYGKQLKVKSQEIMMPFALITALYALYALMILLPSARLSFFFPPQGQLILLTIAFLLVLLSGHFAIISYAALLMKKTWWESVKKALKIGTLRLHTFLFAYLLVLGYVVGLEFLLRLLDWGFGKEVYLVVGLLLMFPSLVLLKFYLVRVAIEELQS